MSDLPDEQLTGIIQQFRAIKRDLVAPDPLGQRETFLWRLEEELDEERRTRSGSRSALRDFGLLVEAAAYGLLRTKTFDLQSYGFPLERPEDRYLTVLVFRTAPGAPDSVAGFFSPRTLVCPAANWESREVLERQVQDVRNEQAGTGGRALLQAFQETFPGGGSVWSAALRWLLETNPVFTRDPGEGNQSNVGPLFLELAPGAPPELVYLPSFSPERLPAVVHRLQGTSYEPAGDKVAVVHNDQTLLTVSIPRADRPSLFGLGNVELRPAELPARHEFDLRTLDLFEQSLAAVINGFAKEIAMDPAARRFRCPDSIRAVIYALGRWPFGDTNWIYSDAALTSGFHVMPHQGEVCTGRLEFVPGGAYYADKTPDQRIAFYIEEWQNRSLNEVTTLGSALWQIFNARKRGQAAGAEAQRLIQVRHHRLSPLTGLVVPEVRQDALSWSNFLYWLDHQTSDLLGAAARRFADQHVLPGIAPRKRTETSTVRIGHHEWRVAE
jgi:hypothetical protein